jgi:S1-C subfamily serine protease
MVKQTVFMVPLILALTTLVGCAAHMALVNHADTYPEKIKGVRPAVVEVLVSGARSGTGFCVSSDGYIVTATHVVGVLEVKGNQVVVNYQQNLTVRFVDGRTIPVQPVDNPAPEGVFHDITVLKADTKTPQFLHLGLPGSVVEGEEVYIMGFPFDVPTAVTYRGNVSAEFPIPAGMLNGTPVQNSTIHVQIPVAKGFSGSPLLRMSDNSVVGVITNKLGGINQKLDEVRQSIQATQGQGRVTIMGVDPNATSLEVINVLDNFLSAGAGWAVSIDYVKPQLEKRNK